MSGAFRRHYATTYLYQVRRLRKAWRKFVHALIEATGVDRLADWVRRHI